MTAQAELNREQRQTLRLIKNDLAFYSANCLKTKTKDNRGIVPVEFDRVQHYIAKMLDEQKERMGWVRAIFIKGRQQRTSTTIAARFFRDAQMCPGTDVFILSHEGKSTDALFQKAALFNSELTMHLPQLAQGVETENQKELKFSNKSSYSVGTAGEKSTGRGKTITRFHGSECAFWDNAEEIQAGALQAVALMANTEIILESTCNGMNWWYDLTMDSLKEDGGSPYEVHFIPWFWTEEYRLPIQPGKRFVRTKEEIDLCRIVKNDPHRPWILDDEQLNWRRAKIVEFRKSVNKFKQEYPCTLTEAFQTSGDAYFPPELVADALNAGNVDSDNYVEIPSYAPKVWGVDVGRRSDRTVLAKRVGRVYPEVRVFYQFLTADNIAGMLKKIIDAGECDMAFLDQALGAAVYDIMVRDGYGDYVQLVDFGSSPNDDQYTNKRAEMHGLMLEFLEMQPCAIRYKNQDQYHEIASDFAMIPEPEEDAHNRKVFISKKELRKKFKRSPDLLDGMILTHAQPVKTDENRKHQTQTTTTQEGSPLSARRRLQNTSNAVSYSTEPSRSSFRRRYI